MGFLYTFKMILFYYKRTPILHKDVVLSLCTHLAVAAPYCAKGSTLSLVVEAMFAIQGAVANIETLTCKSHKGGLCGESVQSINNFLRVIPRCTHLI